MSALLGLLDRNGDPLEAGILERMHERLAHRGPDGGDCWQARRVGLGHQLLATTPQARDEQPYRDGDLVITADARLDNRAKLLAALSGRCRRSRQRPPIVTCYLQPIESGALRVSST